MLHDIALDFADIFNEVGRISANVGASSADAEGNALYDFVATTRYDGELLARFRVEALSALTPVFSQFMSCLLSEKEKVIIRLDMPGNFNAQYLEAVRLAARDFMVNAILASWFAIKAKAEQGQYAQKAAANLVDINSKLYVRKAPIRHEPK